MKVCTQILSQKDKKAFTFFFFFVPPWETDFHDDHLHKCAWIERKATIETASAFLHWGCAKTTYASSGEYLSSWCINCKLIVTFPFGEKPTKSTSMLLRQSTRRRWSRWPILLLLGVDRWFQKMTCFGVWLVHRRERPIQGKLICNCWCTSCLRYRVCCFV